MEFWKRGELTMKLNKSLANIGVATLLAVTIAGTSTPMIPLEVFANTEVAPTESSNSNLDTAKQNYDEKTEAYEKAKALYEKATQSAEAEAEVLAQLEEGYRKAGIDVQELYDSFEKLGGDELDKTSKEIIALDKQLEEQRNQLNIAQAERDEAQRNLDMKKSEAEALESEIAKLKVGLDVSTDNTDAINSLKEEINSLQAKKEAAEKELETVSAQVNEISSRVEEAKSQKASYEAELVSLRSEKESLSTELSNKKDELSKAEAEEAETSAKAEALKNEINSLQVKQNNLNAEYSEIKAKADAAEAEVARLSESINKRDALVSQIAGYQTDLTAAQAELDEKTAQLEEHNTTLATLNTENEALEAEYNSLIAEKNQVEHDIANYESERDVRIAKLNETKQQYEESLAEAQELLASVGIDYVDSICASYETGTSMTISEYFEYAIANSQELINAGYTTGNSLAALRAYYFNCFTVENLNKSMDFIDRTNSVRQTEPIAAERAAANGLSEVPILTVGVSGMKYNALNAAQFHRRNSTGHLLFGTSIYKKANQDRSLSLSTSENIARSYSDPVYAWYESEIEAYRRYLNGEQVNHNSYGHAANLLNPSSTVVSIAFDGYSASQSFYDTGKLPTAYLYPDLTGAKALNMTTAQFREGLAAMQSSRQADIDAINSQIADINLQIEDEQNNLSLPKFQERLAELQRIIEENRNSFNQNNESVKSAAESKAALEADISSLTNTISNLSNSISNSQKKLATYEGVDAEYNAAKEAFDNYSSQKAIAKAALDETVLKLEAAQNSYAELLKKSGELTESINNLNARISEIEARLSEIDQNEINAMSNIDEVSAELEALQNDLNSVTKQYDYLNNVKEFTTEAIASRNADIALLEGGNRRKIQVKVKELSAKLTEINTAVTELTGEVTNLNNQIDEAAAQIEAMEASRNELDHTVRTLELASELADQKTAVSNAEAEKDDAYQTMIAAENEMEAARIIYELILEETNKPAVDGAYRIKGDTRYDTALIAAEALKRTQKAEKFNTIILATGETFADALSGSYLAAKRGNAPIISINPKNGATQDKTIKYINGNLAEGGEVIILGSYSAVPRSVDSRIIGRVTRIAGSTRYDTNIRILEAAGVDSADELLVSTGANFADSLSGSATGKPILLVDKNMTDAQNKFVAKYFKGSNKRITVLGSTSSVSVGVYNNLKKYNTLISRIAGATRYETSRLIAERYFGNAKHAVIAYGNNFPDGLAGGPLAMQLGGPLILSDGKKDTAQKLAKYTTKFEISTGYILGSVTLISNEVARIILNCESISDFE